MDNAGTGPTGNALPKPAPYKGFDGQYINGSWRAGSLGSKSTDNDPYSGEVLAEIIECNQSDLDEAYRTAAKAQTGWAATAPAARAAVMLRAVSILDARHDEITDWIVRESGGTRLKAEAEFQSTRWITLEAASFPNRVEGRILATDEPRYDAHQRPQRS
jgi:aldehyde dehydrogenase (NAD+)